MPASTDRIEFAPPPSGGRAPALAFALLAHLLLMAALTWGIHWNRESENAAVEAELWSSVPQQAAPKLVEPPPAPPAPAPEPPRRVETPPPPPAPREADIAIEREKQLREQRRLHEEELEKQKKLEAKRKQEELKREQLAEQKAAEEKRRKEEQQARLKKQREEDARLAKLREDNIKRMQGLAGATGGPTSTGAVQRSAGPSASYGAKIQARVRPNIVYADDASGNPSADVEVHMAPDGTITSRKVVKPSGVKAWDDAVLRALDKTEVLPRDEDGRVPPSLIITFRPSK